MHRAYIKDLRHRHSYELRPDDALEAAVRALAAQLESAGLLEPGAATAPRFVPHLTLARAATLHADAVDAAAHELMRHGTRVRLDTVVTFGDGRIVCLVPSDRTALDAARAEVLARIAPDDLDPSVAARPWTPHVTVAYAVPDAARAAARDHVERALPLEGAWASCQAWDLDVRPTRLEHLAPCVLDPDGG